MILTFLGKILPDFSKIINRNLENVFNISKDLLGDASFIPQLSEEQFTQQIQNIRNTFLMPAERSGLHLFYRELSTRRTALLHHVSKENIDLQELLRDVIRSRYAMPIADYINWLNQLSENPHNSPGRFHDCGEFLKKTLVQGAYAVSRRTGDITFKPYQRKRDGNPTPIMGLHMTSSTVKSLFGLWFYLENQAKVGDLLMIDEPELNLHLGFQGAWRTFLQPLTEPGSPGAPAPRSPAVGLPPSASAGQSHCHGPGAPTPLGRRYWAPSWFPGFCPGSGSPRPATPV